MRAFFILLSLFLMTSCEVPDLANISKILIDQVQPSTGDTNYEQEPAPYYEEGEVYTDEYGNTYTVDDITKYGNDDPEPEERPRPRRGCRSDYDSDSGFRVDRLEYIDSNNMSDYEIKGRCEQSGEKIQVTINGHPLDTVLRCKSKKWRLEVDLTPLATEESLSFKISNGDYTFCEDVKVAFTYPKNYVTIPALEGDDLYETSFFVMKYEAKLKKAGINSKALSEARGRPIASISYSDAEDLCKNNGIRYNLITNSQWQNIARDIESVNDNWSAGRARVIEGNLLNCGLARGASQAASKDDDDDCAKTSCSRGWDYNRRTHLLSSGDRIWDICGNVGEVMRDAHSGATTGSDYIYELGGTLKDKFGPAKDYNLISLSRNSGYFGLGEFKMNRGGEVIVRGSPGRSPGIFSTEVTAKRSSGRAGHGTGFRCVYLP
ncbi:MAG: hypothetical protein ACR2M7_00405 [Bdellovibrionales bacterium]